MQLTVETGSVLDKKTDVLVLGLFKGENKLEGALEAVDRALDGAISSLIRSGDFSGAMVQPDPPYTYYRYPQTTVLYSNGKIGAKRVLLAGLGERSLFDPEVARIVAGRVYVRVRDLGLDSYIFVAEGLASSSRLAAIIEALVEGSEFASYSFAQFKTEEERLPHQVKEMNVWIEDVSLKNTALEAVRTAKTVCDATKLARDVANTPSSDMTPTKIASIAKEMAEAHGLKCTILDREDIARLRMGGVLGVSRGSHQPPKVVILEYQGAPKNTAPIALVGKGITFDSGGISLKPPEKMDEMKYDKSGAASVIATMQAVAALKLPLNLVCVAPLTENLPGGAAQKPGDIIRHYGGVTSEIVNTDAEGRLILADALAYSTDYAPQAIIDLATLTGACVVALGTHASGLVTNNQNLAQMLVEAGEASGERVWQLPLWQDYIDQIKSEVADIKNSVGRPGGAITAAAFLNRFVGKYAWAHIDIAGTAWTQDGSTEKTYMTKGATGVGVRLLTKLLRNWRPIRAKQVKKK